MSIDERTITKRRKLSPIDLVSTACHLLRALLACGRMKNVRLVSNSMRNDKWKWDEGKSDMNLTHILIGINTLEERVRKEVAVAHHHRDFRTFVRLRMEVHHSVFDIEANRTYFGNWSRSGKVLQLIVEILQKRLTNFRKLKITWNS